MLRCWELNLELCKPSVSIFVTNIILMYNWEFDSAFIEKEFCFRLACHKIKGILKESGLYVCIEERMLFYYFDIYIILLASIDDYRISSFIILFLPSICIMEDIMRRHFKPFNLIWIFTVSLKDSIPCCSLFIEFINKSTFFEWFLFLEFQWQIRNNAVLFGNKEVMEHSCGKKRDCHIMFHLSCSV